MNDPQSVQGWQTWQVVESAMTQMRTAGMNGKPYGLDHAACERMCIAMGFDVPMVMQLLPYVEMGMIRGINKQIKEKEM